MTTFMLSLFFLFLGKDEEPINIWFVGDLTMAWKTAIKIDTTRQLSLVED